MSVAGSELSAVPCTLAGVLASNLVQQAASSSISPSDSVAASSILQKTLGEMAQRENVGGNIDAALSSGPLGTSSSSSSAGSSGASSASSSNASDNSSYSESPFSSVAEQRESPAPVPLKLVVTSPNGHEANLDTTIAPGALVGLVSPTISIVQSCVSAPQANKVQISPKPSKVVQPLSELKTPDLHRSEKEPFSWTIRSPREEETEEPAGELYYNLLVCRVALRQPFVTSDKKYLRTVAQVPAPYDSVVYEAPNNSHCVYMVRSKKQILPLYNVELEAKNIEDVGSSGQAAVKAKSLEDVTCYNCRQANKSGVASDWSVEVEGWSLCTPCLDDFVMFFPEYRRQKNVVPIEEMTPRTARCSDHPAESLDLW